MSWPTASIAITGTSIPVSDHNQLLADLRAVNGFVRKTADESVTSSTVLQNDDHLSYAISNTGTYVFDINLFALSAANAAGDLQVGFSFPTGTLHFGGPTIDGAIASGTVASAAWNGQLSATSGTSALGCGLSTSTNFISMRGILIATATGTLQMMWAQLASNASASTLKAGSWMTVKQVA